MSKNLLYLLAAAGQNLGIEDYYYLAVPSSIDPYLQIFCFSPDGIVEVPISGAALPNDVYAFQDIKWGGKYLAISMYLSSGKTTVAIYHVTKELATRCTIDGLSSLDPYFIFYKLDVNKNGSAIVANTDVKAVRSAPIGYGDPYSPLFDVCGGTLKTPYYEYENPDPPPPKLRGLNWPYADGGGDIFCHIAHIGMYRVSDTEFKLNATDPDAYWFSYPDSDPSYKNTPSPPDLFMADAGIKFISENEFVFGGGSGTSVYVDTKYALRYGEIDLSTGKICYKLIQDTSIDFTKVSAKNIYDGPCYLFADDQFSGQGISIAASSGIYGADSCNGIVVCSVWGMLAPAPELWIYEDGDKMPAISDLSNYTWTYNSSGIMNASISRDTKLLAVPTIYDGVILYLRDGTSFTKITDLPPEWPDSIVVHTLQFSDIQK